jgi:hypothetical protein
MESREPTKTNDLNDSRSAMLDLLWDNYYDTERQILHANCDAGFFSNYSTALWALADLAAEGIVPERVAERGASEGSRAAFFASRGGVL